MQEFLITGVMSGSSLDGLDIALCRFKYDIRKEQILDWSIIHGETIAFPDTWKKRLRILPSVSGRELMAAHTDFGRFIGESVAAFHQRLGKEPQYVASHGHTVFHEPNSPIPFTTQIGDGATLAVDCGQPVICDFRSADVAAGGQGAPMAPLADVHLFPTYDGWLNIGGIANITLRTGADSIQAFDICGANQILNALAAEVGLEMDRNGLLADSGQVDHALLDLAAEDPFLHLSPPRSLSNQQVLDGPVKLFRNHPSSLADRLATATAFIAREITQVLPPVQAQNAQLLVTGGGTFNKALLRQLSKQALIKGWIIEKPTDDIIHNKEALLMALAGLFRVLGRPNFLKQATGADVDTCGGTIYLPRKNYLR